MTQTIRLALATFVAGFLLEAGAEVYQFVSYGLNVPSWVGFYWIGLVTTGLGFYFMYRGRHEWTELHHLRVRQGHRLLWAAIAIFVGAFLVIAVLGTLEGSSAGSGTPPELAWVVGGLVALAFGNFFLSLTTLVDQLVGRFGQAMAWAGFVWSLGVAVLTGFLVGGEFDTLLQQFFTNPLALVVGFAPLAFVIAPLFVSYLLFAAAYTDAYRRLARARTPPPTAA